MMNLPDTFAGGQFGLPLKVAKIVRLAESSPAERPTCNEKLNKYGYFVDRIGICWPINKTPAFARDKEDQQLMEEK
jgi:hypothetical protein